MNDLPALITAGTLAASTIGGGFVWVVTWVQRRFEKIEKALAECKKRELQQVKINGGHVTVIEMLWRECERLGDDATRAVLKRSEKVLDDLKRRSASNDLDGGDKE
jgi:hypothetical protein